MKTRKADRMKQNAKVVVCQKHDRIYDTGQGGYEYDGNLWEECPMCWLSSHGEEGERKIAEKFSLDLKQGDIVEVWFARSEGDVSMQNALSQLGRGEPADYPGPKFAFDAMVENYLLTPEGPELRMEANWEWIVLKGMTGRRFLCDRVPWPGARMEFAGAHPEDAEWSLRVLPEACPMGDDGFPADEVFDRLSDVGDTCRIYRKEVVEQ